MFRFGDADGLDPLLEGDPLVFTDPGGSDHPPPLSGSPAADIDARACHTGAPSNRGPLSPHPDPNTEAAI